MSEIETKLLTVFHPQTNSQTEIINQELEVNNKIYSATKVSLFMENYGRQLRTEADIRRKRKVERAMEFAERMKKVWEKVRVVLRKTQEEMKQQADKGRMEVKEWKKGDKVILSTKDLVFKEQLVRKLVD